MEIQKRNKRENAIWVFEHDALYTHKGPRPLSASELKALQVFHTKEGQRYYQLVYQGIRFKSYVGVLQVGPLVITVLPKADQEDAVQENTGIWQKKLIEMLRTAGVFKTHAPTVSALSLKANHLLDLYLELFIREVEYLCHKGLVKQYRKVIGNKTALKGKLLFSKQLQKNSVQQQRFFVRYNQYDSQHLLHLILYKTLRLIGHINRNMGLSSRLGHLLLLFPEMPDIKIHETLFDRLTITRKTSDYTSAIDIAKLLLLNYHPDLQQGTHHVLALLFNMNRLWERFLYVSLRKQLPPAWSITAQDKKDFWLLNAEHRITLKPDIVLYPANGAPLILDTKWKAIGSTNPSASDLQQLFSYLMLYRSSKVALVYPGKRRISKGYYNVQAHNTEQPPSCTVLCIPSGDDIQAWQKQIACQIFDDWLSDDESSQVSCPNELPSPFLS